MPTTPDTQKGCAFRTTQPMKKFHCSHPGCGKAFKRRDYLTRHELNHSVVRPFTCDLCSVSFARKDLLDKHSRSKTHLLNSHREPWKHGAGSSTVDSKRLRQTTESMEPEQPTIEVEKGRLPQVANIIEDSFGWLFGAPGSDDDDVRPEVNGLFELDLTDFVMPSTGTSERFDFDLSDDTLNKLHEFLRSEGFDPEVYGMFTLRKIDFFLTEYWSKFNSMFPIIHRATFDVNAHENTSLNIAFLLSLITMGVVSASTNTTLYTDEYHVCIRIQKKLRHHLYQIMDDSDLSFVPLKLLQALLINDVFHMYYDDLQEHTNFKIYHPVTINMLKEMKLFSHLAEPMVDPEHFNYASWCQWVRFESLKRIAYLAFIIDTQSTSFFGMTPSLTVFDLQLELPYSDSVWVARDSTDFAAEYKKLPRELVVREEAIDADIQSQSCRYEEVFANGNLIPNVKSEDHWPNLLWSLRRLMQTHGKVVLKNREYDFDCFSLFSRLIMLHGVMSLVNYLRANLTTFNVGLAAKVEHGFISWRTYFQFHLGGRASLNSYADSSPIFWANVTILHSGLLNLYCNFDMILNYTRSILNEDMIRNHAPGIIRYDVIETSRNKMNVQAWVKSRDGEHGLRQACIILKMVLADEEMVARIPHLPYCIYLATLVCWVHVYQEDFRWGQSPPTKENALLFISSTLERTPRKALVSSLVQYFHFVLTKHSKWMSMNNRLLKELLMLSQML